MGSEQKSFRFWVSYYDVAQELTPKQQGEFYRAIVEYMFTDTDPEDSLKGTVRICFKAIKANLKTSRKRSQAGIAGNEKRWDNGIANESQIKTKSKNKRESKSDSDRNADEPEHATSMPDSCRAELVSLGLVREVQG